MKTFSFKDNLTVFIDAFRHKQIPTFEQLIAIERRHTNNQNYCYQPDEPEEKQMQNTLIHSYMLRNSLIWLSNDDYEKISDFELRNLLGDFKFILLASVKIELIHSGHYYRAWKLQTLRERSCMGSLNYDALETIINTVLSKIRFFSYNGFKRYIKTIVRGGSDDILE